MSQNAQFQPMGVSSIAPSHNFPQADRPDVFSQYANHEQNQLTNT